MKSREYSLASVSETVPCEKLTAVPLPVRLDLREAEPLISFIDQLVQEEVKRNEFYHGAILFGSLSRGQAHNGSDIDLQHIVSHNARRQYLAMESKLGIIFRDLYGMSHVDQIHRGLDTLQELPVIFASENSGDADASGLDKHSKVLIPNPAIKRIVCATLQFTNKEPVTGRNMAKKRVIKEEPLQLKVHRLDTLVLPSFLSKKDGDY